MKNYRELVPRTPPEGFLDWCREKARTRDEEDPLDLHGLVFEAEWVEEEGIAPMPVSYNTSPSPRDRTRSRMPSSA